MAIDTILYIDDSKSSSRNIPTSYRMRGMKC